MRVNKKTTKSNFKASRSSTHPLRRKSLSQGSCSFQGSRLKLRPLSFGHARFGPVVFPLASGLHLFKGKKGVQSCRSGQQRRQQQIEKAISIRNETPDAHCQSGHHLLTVEPGHLLGHKRKGTSQIFAETFQHRPGGSLGCRASGHLGSRAGLDESRDSLPFRPRRHDEPPLLPLGRVPLPLAVGDQVHRVGLIVLVHHQGVPGAPDVGADGVKALGRVARLPRGSGLRRGQSGVQPRNALRRPRRHKREEHLEMKRSKTGVVSFVKIKREQRNFGGSTQRKRKGSSTRLPLPGCVPAETGVEARSLHTTHRGAPVESIRPVNEGPINSGCG